MPDRNAALTGSGIDPGPVLALMARGLSDAGADALAIACNTAHAYLGAIERAVSIPVIDMISIAVRALRARHPQVHRVGLLAGDGCLAAGLYQDRLTEAQLLPYRSNRSVSRTSWSSCT